MSAPLRPAVAVVVSRFPTLTETFILREIIEMERQGQPVVLVPLLREEPSVVHPEAVPWVARALYTPFLSPSIVRANWRAIRRTPRRYFSVLALILLRTIRDWNLFARSIALFPKAVYLAERLQQEDVNHVHAHFATHPTTVAMIVSALTDIRFSFTAHAHDIFVRRALLEEKIARAQFVRVISQFNARYLESRYRDATDEKVAVIHAGVPVDTYAASPSTNGEPSDPVRILCVAALKPYKGLFVLIGACRHLEEHGVDFQLDLIGGGPLREKIALAVRDCGLTHRIRLLGARSEGEVTQRLLTASLFVAPSVVARDGQMDGIPVALMEAMAAAIPVVASDLSGIPELVEDGVSGCLVEPGNDMDLAAAMRKLIDDPAYAHQLGQNGRVKVKRDFDLSTCVGLLIARFDPDRQRGVVGLRRVHRSRDARVAEVIVPTSGDVRERIIKVHQTRAGESRPACERAAREFETLVALYRGLASPYSVPRPLYLDVARATIVMERCAGSPLQQLVREARTTMNRRHWIALVPVLRRTGAWLRHFQQQTTVDADIGSAFDALVDRARSDLQACRERLPDDRIAALATRLEHLIGQSRPNSIRLVGQHGDFWPGNVYIDGDDVRVIDFEGFRYGLPYEDVSYFLLQLKLLTDYPLLRSRGRRLSHAFLAGYEAGNVVDKPALELCHMVQTLAALTRFGAPSTLADRWRQRTLRAQLVAP